MGPTLAHAKPSNRHVSRGKNMADCILTVASFDARVIISGVF